MFCGPQRENIPVERIFLVRRLLWSGNWCWRGRLRRSLILAGLVLGFSIILRVALRLLCFLLLGLFGLAFLSLLPFCLQLRYLFGAQHGFRGRVICDTRGEPGIAEV